MPPKRKRSVLKDVQAKNADKEDVGLKRKKIEEQDGRKKRHNSPKPSISNCIPECLKQFSTLVDFTEFQEKLTKIKDARLVGPCRLLIEGKEPIGIDDFMLDRQLTDLPEMQTFLTFDEGRYAFWRDEPTEESAFIVYCTNDNSFPTISVVGNKIEHAIVDLCKSSGKASELMGIADDGWEKQMKSFRSERKKETIGEPPHNVGIKIKMKGNVGYRSLFMGTKKIKSVLQKLYLMETREEAKNLLYELQEEYRHVQIANDECDFGMGLEYGHWLFLSNAKLTYKAALISLRTTYSLLNRKEFVEILEKTMEMKEKLR